MATRRETDPRSSWVSSGSRRAAARAGAGALLGGALCAAVVLTVGSVPASPDAPPVEAVPPIYRLCGTRAPSVMMLFDYTTSFIGNGSAVWEGSRSWMRERIRERIESELRSRLPQPALRGFYTDAQGNTTVEDPTQADGTPNPVLGAAPAQYTSLGEALERIAKEARDTRPVLVVFSDGVDSTPTGCGSGSKSPSAVLLAAPNKDAFSRTFFIVLDPLPGMEQCHRAVADTTWCNAATRCEVIDLRAKEKPLQALSARFGAMAVTKVKPEVLRKERDALLADLGAHLTTAFEPIVSAAADRVRGELPNVRLDFDDVGLVESGARRCSGVLVAPRLALTAAHCLPADTFTLTESEGTARTVHAVKSAVRHPDARLDVALLKLSVRSDARIHARRTPADTTPPEGVLRHLGFGAPVDAADPVARKRSVDLQASGWGCEGERAAVTGCRPGWEMVLAATAGADTCRGDSGGAAFELVAGAESGCDYRLVGITSRRTDNAVVQCGQGGVYTRVDALKGWIDETLQKMEAEER